MPQSAIANSTACERVFPVQDYNLAATLDSGQAFRWRSLGNDWIGVIHGRWVRLRVGGNILTAKTAAPVEEWEWLTDYLQLNLELSSVLATFPQDDPMRAAIAFCRGLRVLRQEPWECLASFILSSTKQIVQIRQIVELLCERHGDPVETPQEHGPVNSFPSASQIASLSEHELRDCKMGFRAPYLLAASRLVAEGRLNLESLGRMTLSGARERLMEVPGVGRKIADCVLLFAYGFPTAFPVDVWVMKALRDLYFPRRRPSRQKIEQFTESYFGPHAGYAQQYLFHYMRTREHPLPSTGRGKR